MLLTDKTTINEKKIAIKNWALTQQQYSIDELLKLEQYDYEDASPELVKRILKNINAKDKRLSIQNWFKGLKKSKADLLAQDEYEYIHADTIFIKNVIEKIEINDIFQNEVAENHQYNWLYNGVIILGTIIIGAILIRSCRHPFFFEVLQTLLRNNQADNDTTQELNLIDNEGQPPPQEIVGLADNQVQPGGENTLCL